MRIAGRVEIEPPPDIAHAEPESGIEPRCLFEIGHGEVDMINRVHTERACPAALALRRGDTTDHAFRNPVCRPGALWWSRCCSIRWCFRRRRFPPTRLPCAKLRL